jgi:hypothetical protein
MGTIICFSGVASKPQSSGQKKCLMLLGFAASTRKDRLQRNGMTDGQRPLMLTACQTQNGVPRVGRAMDKLLTASRLRTTRSNRQNHCPGFLGRMSSDAPAKGERHVLFIR